MGVLSECFPGKSRPRRRASREDGLFLAAHWAKLHSHLLSMPLCGKGMTSPWPGDTVVVLAVWCFTAQLQRPDNVAVGTVTAD